jgi:hypothetical protein
MTTIPTSPDRALIRISSLYVMTSSPGSSHLFVIDLPLQFTSFFAGSNRIYNLSSCVAFPAQPSVLAYSGSFNEHIIPGGKAGEKKCGVS